MGSQNSRTRDISSFNLDEWQPISQDFRFCSKNSMDQIVIYQHKVCKNMQMEMYPLLFSGPSQYMAYADLLAWRNSQKSFVSIKYVSSQLKKSFCSNFYFVNVFIERMPQRLRNLKLVSIEVYVYLLSVAFEGFRRIFDKIGYFQIESQLFCINNEGNLKIWLNPNLAKNYPQFSKINHNKDDHDFVMDIIKRIEKVANKSINPTFNTFLNNAIGTERTTFKAVQKLLETYIKRYNIDKITSVKQRHIPRKTSVKNSLTSSIIGERPKTNTLYQYNITHKKTAKKLISHKKNQQSLEQNREKNKAHKAKLIQQGYSTRSKSPSFHKKSNPSIIDKQICISNFDSSSNHFQHSTINKFQRSKHAAISFRRYETSPTPLIQQKSTFSNPSQIEIHKKQQNFYEQIKEIQKNSQLHSSSSYDMDPDIKKDLANFELH